MNRRDFLQTSLFASLASNSVSSALAKQQIMGFAPLKNRTLLNLMLEGGADFRHIIVPEYSSKPNTFGYHYWRARAASHGVSKTHRELKKFWENHFVHRNTEQHSNKPKQGTSFGIAKSCDWLIKMWDAGHAAIICNAVGSTSRNHDFAVQVMKQGNTLAELGDTNYSGWGGRLAHSTQGAVVRLSHIPSHFCYGPQGNDITNIDNSKLITLADSRSIGLYEATVDTGTRSGYSDQSAARSMAAYYRGLRKELPNGSAYERFLQHEQTLRQFGGLIRQRLNNIPVPENIAALLTKPDFVAMNGFGKQIRNAYDTLACNDITNARVLSMECGDWDSHSDQKSYVDPMFLDVFGKERGFDSLWSALGAEAKSKTQRENLVVLMAGEFGRQLRCNGGNGTDHGSGNMMLVFGEKVRGGVYGDIFPEREIDAIADTSIVNPDTVGLTDFDHVFGSVCDWVSPNASRFVFPNRKKAKIEKNNLLKKLFI